ncbi:fam-a protein [Plasmodium chabaudi chabaudi]|uniref:Fam-a protein n=2 Tax=Plasmodium chabaudi chabaudi TaxID=31271 RepID=A0A1C6WKC9_PLACU|nr:fam-a protein [Plasmodium chabaudi chabaudi]
MNKMYMKTVFSILALFTYGSTKALGSESIPNEFILTNDITHPVVDDPNEIYEQNKHLLCTNTEEIYHASEVMDDALEKLYYYAENEYVYNLYKEYNRDTRLHFNNNIANEGIGKFDIKIRYPDAYDEIVNILWDPNGATKYNPDFVSGKVIHVYNPNLLMIQQRYKNGFTDTHKYFYALTAKYKISETRTIITMSTVNVNDRNRKDGNEYVNTIVKSADLFKANVDSEEDIRNGELKKMFVQLSGYLITKKKDYVEIINIDSINDNDSDSTPESHKLSNKFKRMERLMELNDYISNKYI